MPIKLVRQDITKIKCDAIVNPSNEQLYPGGGTDMAIHMAAGEKLLENCKNLGGCEVGKAKITSGFKLPCKYVIHTVGPLWIDGNHGENDLLVSCYKECLSIAKKKRCKTVAFPLISSGTHGFPKDKVLKIALDTIGSFLFENEMMVYIVVYDKKSYEISKSIFADVESLIADTLDEKKESVYDFLVDLDRIHNSLPKECSCIEMDFCEASYDSDEICDVESSYGGGVPSYSVPKSSAKNISAPLYKSLSLDDMLKKMDKSFAEMLFYYIDLKGITDVQCYKKANVDKKTFSKIKCKKDYKPSKQTALSFAIALELDLEETSRLLQTVGMTLSNSNKFDIIVRYFIINGKYNIYEINETLFKFDQMLLGSV